MCYTVTKFYRNSVQQSGFVQMFTCNGEDTAQAACLTFITIGTPITGNAQQNQQIERIIIIHLVFVMAFTHTVLGNSTKGNIKGKT